MTLVRLALALTALSVTTGAAWAQPGGAAARGEPPIRLAANDGPSEGELEYWRSVQRIDTPAAYRSYVESFPGGFFVGLAQLKLSGAAPKAGESIAAPSPALEPARAAGSLRSFSELLANSAAVTLNLGDRLNGPGLLTVGSVGARKQLVIPPGEWILLAAADTKSVQLIAPYARESAVALTTLTLGRFAGNRLATLIRATMSRQVVHVNNWTDYAGCDRASGSSGLEHTRTRAGLRDECSGLRAEENPAERLLTASEELKASLDRLGATVSGAGLVSTLSFADPRLGYLGMMRVDWPGTVLGATAERASAWRAGRIENFAAHQSYLRRLVDWSQSYRRLATDGFVRAIDSVDTVPNVPARPNQEFSALTDFDPVGTFAKR